MKMAEPPAEALAEETSPPNPEDSIEKAPTTEDTEVAVIEDGTREDNSAAQETTAHNVEDKTDGINGDIESNGDAKVDVKNEDITAKSETNEEKCDKNKKDEKVDGSANESGDATKENEDINSKEHITNENDIQNDEKNGEEKTNAPIEPEVTEKDKTEPHNGTTDDITATEECVENGHDDEDVSALSEEELRVRYESLYTKYSAAELQLDSLREQNAKLHAKLQNMEDEPKKTEGSLSKSSSANELREKARQRDGFSVQADYLAHELSQQQDTEKYLREKVTEILEEKEESERKVKDLQLKLKRFVKDDQAKDERVAKLETELREVSQELQQLESYLDEETLQKVQRNRSSSERSGQNGEVGGTTARYQTSSPTPQSKTCVIL